MYHPVFQLLGTTISSWVLFGLGNILIGKLVILYLGYRRGWNLVHWIVIILFSTLGGTLAALLIPSIMSVVLGAVGFLLLAKRLLGFRHDVGDLIAVYLAVAIGIGRIGCLINGCCFGAPTHLPWGITYPVGTPAHWLHVFTGQIEPFQNTSLAVHPVQLYESIFMAVALVVILVFNRYVRRKTVLLLGFLGVYLWFRFFIEFIRDMTNVWWGEIVWGPFSVFQWFLLLVGAFLLLLAVKQQQQPARQYSPTIRLDPEWLLGITGAGILLGHTYFQPIQLVQLLLFFPLGVVGVLWEKRRQPVYRSVLAGLAGSIIIILLSTSLVSRLQAQGPDASGPVLRSSHSKNWLYVINPADQKLVRFGDQQLSFSEYLLKQKALGWAKTKGMSDTASYRELTQALSRNSLTYYGVLGMGNYEYQVQGCGGGVTTYQHRYTGLSLGMEKQKSKPKYTAYHGFFGSIYQDDWTESGLQSYGVDRFRTTFGSVNTYVHVDRKYAGFGTGFSIAGLIPMDTGDEYAIFPNFYLRLGPSHFNLEAGFNDRTLVRPDPFTAHLNVVLEPAPSTVLRIGTVNMGLQFGAFFVDLYKRKHTGLVWHPSIYYLNGLSANLKLEYTPPESGKR